MEQLQDLADDRLIHGCVYCGGLSETRDHVPSRILMDRPYPENLPVVGCCNECNQSFSLDEQYLACLVESAIVGTTDPDELRRPSIARIMRKSPALRSRIDAAKQEFDGRLAFAAEHDRVVNVVLKLAKGHAAFELSQPQHRLPDHIWCGPLETMAEDIREQFNAVHFQQMFGEVGSRGIQRMIAAGINLPSQEGEAQKLTSLLINDWVDIQIGNYRYLAIDDVGGIVIRIVIGEYLACEVAWLDEVWQ